MTRKIPVGPGPRGLSVDVQDDTLYVTNFDRTHQPYEGFETAEYGPNTLTVIDLASAPLDSDAGQFTHHSIRVGYGPCSVAVLDLSGLPQNVRSGGAIAHA
jgi:DNA-binding beta-propeller fold protein YncE